ncbi:hypothetical protein [Leptospira harrisiae]|nr:hypothetical protein [Leptospira harrisiae]
MKEFTLFEGISNVNAGESNFGDFLFYNNKLIIPFFNIFIIPDKDHNLRNYNSKFIEFSYLIFENVTAIVWEYELSRFLHEENRECYGGIYYLDNLYYEFWLNYSKGYLLLEEGTRISDKPWSDETNQHINFYKSSHTNPRLKNFLEPRQN